jgi:transcriptional regulator with XRE-family HTH domain
MAGMAIRRARQRAGVAQAALAARLGVSTAYVSKLEAGRSNPTIGMLARVAAALDAVLAIDLQPAETAASPADDAGRSATTA